MSQENVEVVRAALAAWNGGDMDSFRECLDPDVIARPPEEWPESGPFFGLEAVMRQFEQFRTTWDTDAIEPISDFTDVGDRVLVRTVVRAVGKGPKSNLEWTYIFTVRKGVVLNIELFWDHAEALEAVGLSEQDVSRGHLSVRETARAMSQENVELFHRGSDAFNRRDLDAYLALIDDDVEFIPRAVAMEGGDHYHGHDGVRRWWKDLFDVFPDFTTEVVEAHDLGDLTLTLLRLRAHGAGSDTPTEESIWNVTRWRRGKCVWWRTFETRTDALEVVGLSEN